MKVRSERTRRETKPTMKTKRGQSGHIGRGVDNCVWDEVERMMHTGYKSQFDGRDIPIDIAAIDGGYLREHVQFFR